MGFEKTILSEDLEKAFYNLFVRQELGTEIDVEVQQALNYKAELFIEKYYKKIIGLLDDFRASYTRMWRYAIVPFDGKGGVKATIFCGTLEETISKVEDMCFEHAWVGTELDHKIAAACPETLLLRPMERVGEFDPEMLGQFRVFDLQEKMNIGSCVSAFLSQKYGV